MSAGDGKGAPPDDPWARWRKPGATAAVNAEKRPKKPADAAPPAAEPPRARAASAPAPRGPRPGAAPAPRKEARPSVPERPARAATPAARPQPPAAPVAATPPAGLAREGVRLSKVMSERGICSRREADLWIERGWVFVAGERLTQLGTRIDPAAEITISKEAQVNQAKQVTILLNKPVGYVSGQPEPGSTPAVTLVTAESQVRQSGDPEFKPWMLRNLAPAGRLDVDSTGLLVLTRDGRIAKQLVGEDSQIEKEYLVRVAGTMIPDGLKLLAHGLELDDQPLKSARVRQLNEDQLHFILKEGKKRQIRRMCELVGLQVTGLKRVRIGHVKLGELPTGKWRFLRADESF